MNEQPLAISGFYDVLDFINRADRRRRQSAGFIAALALGGIFTDAYDFTSLGIGAVQLRQQFHLSPVALGTLTAIMALGALFGVVKIMYAAVRARTREIGTLRAIGFGAGPVAASVLVEAAVLGVLGALAGTALAWLIFDGREMWVWGAFRLRVALSLLALGIVWALVTALLGGLFPALRAARIPASEALRAA